jgi:3-oxoacyl-[acyl-carrier protein] reductase
VTGVSRSEGIGFAIARRLVADGAAVFTQGWEAHDASQPWGAGEVPLREGLSGHLEADLADPEAPAVVLAAARLALGNVDVLVANHAASVGGRLEDLTPASIDEALAVNVRATLLLVQAFAAAFEGDHGRVVLLTSGQGRGPMPAELPYAASKAALSGVVLSLSDQLASRGITVNAVNPGPTDTGWASEEIEARVAAAMPRGRWGTPDDAARLVAWLASEASEWVTGQVIDSDGGFRYGGA